MRRCLALAGLMLALPTAAPAAVLEVSAAWHGFARPERPTELAIGVESAPGGVAEIEISAGPRRIVTTLELAAGVASEVRLPVPALESIAVRARLPEGAVLERQFRLALAERPLVATSVPLALAADWAELPVDAGALPRGSEPYAAVDAVVVDGATLALLSPPQLSALLGHLSRCGRVVTVGLETAAADVLQQAAGCSGRSLAQVPTAGAAPAALAALFDAALADAPTADALHAVLPAAHDSWALVAGGMAIYLVVAGLVALFAPAPRAAAAVALGTAVLVWSVPELAAPAGRLGIWAELGAGERTATYAGLEALAGTGRRHVAITLPLALRGAAPCREGEPPARWAWDARQSRFLALDFDARLFEERQVCFGGEFPTARAAEVEAEPGGALRVRNTSPGPSPAGAAFAGGRVYALPPLAAGESRELPSGTARGARGARERLALERASAGLLWPLELPALGLPEGRAVASLLMRSSPQVAQ